MHSEGLFSGDFNLDLLYYFSFAVGVSAAIFVALTIFWNFNKTDKPQIKKFNTFKTWRISLEGFCWFFPIAGFLKFAPQNPVAVAIMVVVYTWPLLLGAVTAHVAYKMAARKLEGLVPKRIEIGFCCFLIIAIIAEELYVHTVYNS